MNVPHIQSPFVFIYFLRLGGMITAYKIVPDEIDEIKVRVSFPPHFYVCLISKSMNVILSVF